MTENSKIEWTDHTFNPWIGCTKVSPGCENCYAENFALRYFPAAKWGSGNSRVRTGERNWKHPLLWNKRAGERGVRERVFCASLADVFDNEVDPQWRMQLWSLIAATPNLDWLLLTKRISNAKTMWPAPIDGVPLHNVWLGISVVNQDEAERDIPKLLETPARVRFLSMEPLLGPVNLNSLHSRHGLMQAWDSCISGKRFSEFGPDVDAPRVDWIIVGGESGPHARPMHIDWACALRDQCLAAGVPFLFKQWGEWESAVKSGRDYEKSGAQFVPGAYHDFGDRFMALRVGKKKAGRMLDGREWNQFPGDV